MLLKWLRASCKVECNSPKKAVHLNLVMPPDSVDWENIFKVVLIPKNVLDDDADIAVKMKVGVILPEPKKPHDPMSYMISDGDYSIGVQLLDPNHDYTTKGPYKPVEGESQKRKLKVDTSDDYSNVLVSTTVQKNPDQFKMKFKPSETFRSAYCAIDDGHMIVAQYGDTLNLSKGLTFELYRYQTERYTINEIEIAVYLDSKPV